MLHTSRHCARPGAVDWYTRSYTDVVAYVDLGSFLWLPRQTLREKGLFKSDEKAPTGRLLGAYIVQLYLQ